MSHDFIRQVFLKVSNLFVQLGLVLVDADDKISIVEDNIVHSIVMIPSNDSGIVERGVIGDPLDRISSNVSSPVVIPRAKVSIC